MKKYPISNEQGIPKSRPVGTHPQQTLMNNASLNVRLTQVVKHLFGCSAKNNSRNGFGNWHSVGQMVGLSKKRLIGRKQFNMGK